MSELQRRSLGPFDVLAQSLGVSAPTGGALTIPTLVIVRTGYGAVWAMVIATVLAFLVAAIINQFTVRVASVGSLYTFTAKGLGPTAAYLSGAGLIIGYGFLAVYSFANIGLRAAKLLHPSAPNHPILWAGCIAVAAVLCAILLTHRIAVSARIALVTEIIAIAMVLLFGGLLLVVRGVHTIDTIDWRAVVSPGVSPRDLAFGSVLAMMALIGFESGAALSVEARHPFATIPRALTSALLATGTIMIIAMIAAPAVTPVRKGDSSPLVSGLSDHYDVPGLAQLFDAATVVSFFVCALASVTALIRVLLAMSIDAIAPSWLGRIDPTSRVPRAPVYLIVPIVALVPAVLLATARSTADVLTTVAIAAVCGLVLAYLLVCLAAPVFLRKIGESTPVQTALALATAAALAVCMTVFFTAPGHNHRDIDLLLVGIAVVVALGLRVVSRRADRIGTHDYPTRGEVFESGPGQGDS